jgi:flagellar basal body rod protein FlgC
MVAYIIIQTVSAKYKCHAYSMKAGRVYFNSRAVNLANVVTITGKEEETLYSNPELTVKPVVKSTMHHVSTLKGADKCKATKVVKPKSKVSAGVIEI